MQSSEFGDILSLILIQGDQLLIANN
jgi:hypothetical protein